MVEQVGSISLRITRTAVARRVCVITDIHQCISIPFLSSVVVWQHSSEIRTRLHVIGDDEMVANT